MTTRYTFNIPKILETLTGRVGWENLAPGEGGTLCYRHTGAAETVGASCFFEGSRLSVKAWSLRSGVQCGLSLDADELMAGRGNRKYAAFVETTEVKEKTMNFDRMTLPALWRLLKWRKRR
jgi:hypothetical protein